MFNLTKTLDEIKQSSSQELVSVRKSNAPLITVFPDRNVRKYSATTVLSCFSLPRVYPSTYDSSVYDKVCSLIKQSKNVVAVTGSGISVASGLKTRQDLWQSHKWDRDECVNIIGQHKDGETIWKLIKSFLLSCL